MLAFVILAASTPSAFCLRLPSAYSRRELAGAGTLAALAFHAKGSVSPAVAADSIATTVLASGDASSPLPQRGQTAVVDYTLWINAFEGKQIDSSKGSAFPPQLPKPFAFQVGVSMVIPGWDRTVRQMHVGDKRRVVIPASLGYGEKGVGPIPGGADLFFEIELLELKPMPSFSEKQKEWLDTHPDTSVG